MVVGVGEMERVDGMGRVEEEVGEVGRGGRGGRHGGQR